MDSTDKTYFEATQQLIVADLDIQTQGFQGENAWEQLRMWLAQLVERKLHNTPEDLLNDLYRLDVSEQKIYAAITNQTDAPASYAIADLIIERELRKVKSRAWYQEQLKNTPMDSEEIDRW
ncbi:MAG: hypothetical protein ACPGXL_05605 [Chitinophagales bacterium]